jgi:hypothetical protein
MHGHSARGTEPLAPTFAPDAEQIGLEIYVGKVQPYELADSKSAAVERLQQCPIPDSKQVVDRNCVEQSNDLVYPE